jgi:type II secretory pathway pseudopilin PulG
MSLKTVVRHAQGGFTIVELMVASLVFTSILVVVSSGVVHFTEDYYKGIHQSATQTAARDAIDTITQNLQYTSNGDHPIKGQGDPSLPPDPNSPNKYICVGGVQIDYQLGYQLGSSSTNDYALVISTKDPTAACKPYSGTGREMLGPKMRLTDLDVNQLAGGASNRFKVSAGVAYGDIELLCSRTLDHAAPGGCRHDSDVLPPDFPWSTDGQNIVCRQGKGQQFCAFSHLDTIVVNRFTPSD